MALNDKVRTVRDIKTFDPKTLRIKTDGIPKGTPGIVVVQDDVKKIVTVEFEVTRTGINGSTKVKGVFADGTVDTIENSLEVILETPPPDVLDVIR